METIKELRDTITSTIKEAEAEMKIASTNEAFTIRSEINMLNNIIGRIDSLEADKNGNVKKGY